MKEQQSYNFTCLTIALLLEKFLAMIKSPEVFIVSSGRSGTTLLVSILNATKQVFIPYESDFVARAYSLYINKESFSVDDYSKLTDVFFQSSQPKGWGMDKSYILDSLCNSSPQSFGDVHSTICHAYHDIQGTADLIWGIKAPVLIASLDRIKHTHPSSKIIHLVRDGRDVYLSYKKVHEKSPIKFGPKTIFENCLYWVDGLRRIDAFQRDEHIYELRYEDLLKNPSEELRKICIFLDIEYDESIHKNFQFFSGNKNLVPEKLSKTLHNKVANGIDPSNAKKYIRQMKVRERFIFEILTSPYLVKYRYDIEFPISRSFLLLPFRLLLYHLARTLNDLRYRRRDIKVASEL